MPIYDQHYHPWPGKPQARWLRWTVITRYHLKLLFTGKGRLGLYVLLLISVAIHFGFLTVIYVLGNPDIITQYGFPADRLPKVDSEFFLAEMISQSFIIAFLTLIMGTGLIADDRRDNAIPLYLSKPLTVSEYLIGKFAVLGVPILCITAVPVNLVYLTHVLVNGGWTFFKAFWWLPISITALSLIIAAFCGAVILMASSLVKKGALAGVVVIGLFIGHNMLAGFLVEIYRNQKVVLLSLQTDFYRLGLWLFRLDHTPAAQHFPFTGLDAGAVILLVTVVCSLIVWWRVRPVEVVK